MGLSSIIQVDGLTAGCNSLLVKQVSGGSLEILGASNQAWASGYLMGSAEVLTFGGPATVFLAATGATAIAHVIKTKTAGT